MLFTYLSMSSSSIGFESKEYQLINPTARVCLLTSTIPCDPQSPNIANFTFLFYIDYNL